LNGFDRVILGLNFSLVVKLLCTYGNGTEQFTFNPRYMTNVIVYSLSWNEPGADNATGTVSSLGHSDICTGEW